jgi:hypothetical protein
VLAWNQSNSHSNKLSGYNRPMWEDRRLRDIAEADLRQLVNSGLQEHLQLEYKGALYSGNHHGSRECLLDICQFANAAGGILLIGVPERRDAHGQPTGSPDPNAQLGITVPNPEAALLALDARVVANIEDRLTTESFAVPISGGLHVLAIRVPNSQTKPHSVHLDGHIYFPSRRERNRYSMDVREIKEMVMRTASRLEQAEQKLKDGFEEMPRQVGEPQLLIGCIPVFGRDFLVNVRDLGVLDATQQFDVSDTPVPMRPLYNFQGLERPISHNNSKVQVRRNGLIVLSRRLPVRLLAAGGAHLLVPMAIDITLRRFMLQTACVYLEASVPGPYLISMKLRVTATLVPAYPDNTIPGAEIHGTPISPGDYPFPTMQADTLVGVDKTILPLCDQAHQLFAQEASPCFNPDGRWNRD